MKEISILLLLQTVLACVNISDRTLSGLEYYPTMSQLEDGLVWKYYEHNHVPDGQTKTNISYHKFLFENDAIYVEQYNAGFQKNYAYQAKMDSSRWYLVSDQSLNFRANRQLPFTVYESSISENVLINWKGDRALLHKTRNENGVDLEIIVNQNINRDSITEDGTHKIFNGQREFTALRDGEQLNYALIDWQIIYSKGLGMTYRSTKYNDVHSELVLDEIMSVKEFERRADHGMHRVAYIDTTKTLDDHTQFSPCSHPDHIYDYYNDERAEFKGGKGRLRAILSEKLNPSALEGNSGYLTYRFVINCNGEAGWFVTEEADLNYNKISFTNECRLHLYDILKAEEKWTNLLLRKEAKDAYAYITFKIENDEIIEILP